MSFIDFLTIIRVFMITLHFLLNAPNFNCNECLKPLLISHLYPQYFSVAILLSTFYEYNILFLMPVLF